MKQWLKILWCLGVPFSLCAQENQAPQNKRQLFDPQKIKESDRVWVEGSFLFWQSSMDQLSYATTSDSTSSLTHATVHAPHFEWTPGFRVGIGYKVPHDHWDLFLDYTQIGARAHGEASRSEGAVFPLWQAPFAAGLGAGDTLYATHANAHWKADVYALDAELGRNCSAGKWLSIRPFMGVRSLFIYQQYHLGYRGGTSAPAGERDQVVLDQDFWGVGLRLGFDSLWGLGGGWGIYGNGAASLLSGHFDVDQHEKLKPSGTPRVDLSEEVKPVVVAAELALGVQWAFAWVAYKVSPAPSPAAKGACQRGNTAPSLRDASP